jgi:hypothetical protein
MFFQGQKGRIFAAQLQQCREVVIMLGSRFAPAACLFGIARESAGNRLRIMRRSAGKARSSRNSKLRAGRLNFGFAELIAIKSSSEHVCGKRIGVCSSG